MGHASLILGLWESTTSLNPLKGGGGRAQQVLPCLKGGAQKVLDRVFPIL